MRKWDEKLRTLLRRLLIVVLLVTAVLLIRETGYFSGAASRGGSAAVSTAAVDQTKPAGTAQPLAAVVCGTDGGRFGAAHDRESVMAVFHRFSADVGEALGSAGAPEEITERELWDCLSRCGLTLRFYSPQPLELLSAWLGTNMSGNAASYRADLLCLCTEGNSALLCFRTETGVCFRCTANVSVEALQNHAAEYTPNGAYYAFEHPLLSGGDGCAVILDGAVSAPVVQCGVSLPMGTELDALLTALGMNSYAARSYKESDGTVVYVDDDTTMRLATAGSMFFHRAGAQEAGRTLDLTDAVSTAWTLAEQSIGKTCGDATLLLAEAAEGEDGRSCTVALDYAVNGIPVRMASGHAAELSFRDGTVIQAKLEFRHYTLTETRETLLPGLQAHAVAAAEQTTAELVYVDGGETMNCIWVRTDG